MGEAVEANSVPAAPAPEPGQQPTSTGRDGSQPLSGLLADSLRLATPTPVSESWALSWEQPQQPGDAEPAEAVTTLTVLTEAPLRLPTGPVAVTEVATGIRVVEAIMPFYQDVRATELGLEPDATYQPPTRGASAQSRLARWSPADLAILLWHESVRVTLHIMNITTIQNTEVTITTPSPPRVQGTIWAPELATHDTAYIQSKLATQLVTAVYRPPRGPQALLHLTFSTDKLPPRIFAGYLAYQVRRLIPRPRRCTHCQRYGHLAAACRSGVVCGTCAGDHATNTCTSTHRECAACGGGHAITAKACPKWQMESEICRLITVDHMPPRQARSLMQREFGFQSPNPRRRMENVPRPPPVDSTHYPPLIPPTTPTTPTTNTASTTHSTPTTHDSEDLFLSQGARPKGSPVNAAPSKESGPHPDGGTPTRDEATYHWVTATTKKKRRSKSLSNHTSPERRQPSRRARGLHSTQ
ncbi:Nucleic-acid-binding protein from transposon X-element [Amphibalanus amphitrite]|uniref:Nucleic-acid-binding protein from transposon X-element n=1 Tax=Amphibalanus amphitrite TaxID=1232801 RepID=A0A6A4W695_AMPAM|nr:Nucleic-acid-binding protein from transposon X-element [Amphibalanus amphitrite]